LPERLFDRSCHPGEQLRSGTPLPGSATSWLASLAGSTGSQLVKGSRSRPIGTNHFRASLSQRAPLALASAFALNGTLR
jgi:hypothetical protein